MKLDISLYAYALDHIVSKGDTDIFPYPFELAFLRHHRAEILAELSSTDISQYSPLSLIESLVPKAKFGFRVAHQPFPVDTLIFTALVCKIFDIVEAGRDPMLERRAFSYRKRPLSDSDFFEPGHTYGDWIKHIGSFVFEDRFSHVIRTDVSDFYSRIYRHRLENILESLSGDKTTVKRIERFVSEWRGGQSFGLPIGTNAARLLAETALNDTDFALIAEGIVHTRYVDDMVIFVQKGDDPYASLAFLAKHLSSNEGLSLNNQKTKILDWDEFMSGMTEHSSEVDDDKEELATERLFWAAYGEDASDPDALDALMLKDLCQELEFELSEPFFDTGKIRIILHAMRLVRNSDVAAYVRANLASLIPFSKDVFLLIEEFIQKGVAGFENISSEIVELLLSSRMRPLDCARAWFLELGARGLVKFSNTEIRRLDALSGILDVRQLHIIRWRSNDVNYFRQMKTRVHELQVWAQPSFIFGASCLPSDEYNHWLRANRSRFHFPLAKLFSDWCLRSHGTDPLTPASQT